MNIDIGNGFVEIICKPSEAVAAMREARKHVPSAEVVHSDIVLTFADPTDIDTILKLKADR